MNSNLVSQLEAFKQFIDTINNTAVQSKTEIHRQFYLNNPELSKKLSSKTEMIRTIGKDFVILSNDNVLTIQEDLEKILQNNTIEFDEGMIRKVINIIHNVIISSNLSENNGKDIYVICIRELDKYVNGFMDTFVESQLAEFNTEILDCLMSFVSITHKYDDKLIDYMLLNPKVSFMACMKYIPSNPKMYDTIFHTFSKKIENMTGYMKYVVNELEKYYASENDSENDSENESENESENDSSTTSSD